MDHVFSWRKVLEATAIVVAIYVIGSPVLGTDLNPISMLQVIGPFVALYMVSSKVLERASKEREGNNSSKNYY